MNKKSWMVLRIVAGLYLVFLGVQIISQVTKEQPNNLASDDMCRRVLFIGSGGCICRCCDQQRMEDEQGRRKISGG